MIGTLDISVAEKMRALAAHAADLPGGSNWHFRKKDRWHFLLFSDVLGKSIWHHQLMCWYRKANRDRWTEMVADENLIREYGELWTTRKNRRQGYG